MKMKNFTLRNLLLAAILLVGTLVLKAQDMGTGTGWGDLGFTSDVILDEDFTGFEFFGSWQHANNSNSRPTTDEVTGETIRGYQEGTKTFNFLNTEEYTVTYTWDSCAFAPEWGVAKSVDNDGIPVDPDPTTSGVSNGFVEIARLYSNHGTLPGEFIVDLSQAEYIEGIQYSHSSCGGSRRGFMVLFSLDSGESWDTLRFQSGDHWSLNYTKDIYTGEKTPSDINCTPSASGMLWEDALFAYDLDVVLMFKADDVENQAVRIHDLKVYGTLPTGGAVNEVAGSFKFKKFKDRVLVTEQANVAVYSISGELVRTVDNTKQVIMNDMPNGIYLLKAQANNKVIATKFVKQ